MTGQLTVAREQLLRIKGVGKRLTHPCDRSELGHQIRACETRIDELMKELAAYEQ